MNPAISHTPPIVLPSDQDATGRSFDAHELAYLSEALESGTLTSTKGRFVRSLEERFAAWLGIDFCHACSSGTAAIHTAIAAIDPEPGDEIITSPITDMGALTPILYQAAIPVFADVDPSTGNITARTIADRLSPRTKAVIVTHLFGNPAEMEEILAVTEPRGIPVIEDAAQAYGASIGGRPVGTVGTIGCFSLQQGKHMTTGEGGLVVTSDAALARRMYLFINKGWGYGDPSPDHTFLALNYRMSELQGAVGLAQIRKLTTMTHDRIAAADRLTTALAGIRGIDRPIVAPNAGHGFWRYVLRVDEKVIPGGAVALGADLRDQGIACLPRYIQKPAFECEIFREKRTFGKSQFPFTMAREEAMDYRRERFPGVYAALASMLVLGWNERFTDHHVDFIAAAVRRGIERIGGKIQ